MASIHTKNANNNLKQIIEKEQNLDNLWIGAEIEESNCNCSSLVNVTWSDGSLYNYNFTQFKEELWNPNETLTKAVFSNGTWIPGN